MMSLVTGVVLVVGLGFIVQKSDLLIEYFETLDGEPSAVETASDAPGAAPEDAPAEDASTEVAAVDSTEPAAEDETPPGWRNPDFRAAFDEVDVAPGGGYLIDVLGNDAGVTLADRAALRLMSAPECGVARVVEGAIGYVAEEGCEDSQSLFYCVEGVDPLRCQEALLVINIVAPVAEPELNPELTDVAPDTTGLAHPSMLAQSPAPDPAASADTARVTLPSPPPVPDAPMLAPRAPAAGPSRPTGPLVPDTGEERLAEGETDVYDLRAASAEAGGQLAALPPSPRPNPADRSAPAAPRTPGAGDLPPATASTDETAGDGAAGSLDRARAGLRVASVEAPSAAPRFELRDRAAGRHASDGEQPLSPFLTGLATDAPAPAAGLAGLGADSAAPGGATRLADAGGARPRATELGGAARTDVAPAIGGADQAARPAQGLAATLTAPQNGGAGLGAPLRVDDVAVVSRGAAPMTPAAADAAPGAQRSDDAPAKVAAVAPAAPAVQPARQPGAPAGCVTQLAALAGRGGLIQIHAAAPCRAGQVLLLLHEGLEFAARFDAAGSLRATLPAFDKDVVVVAVSEDGEKVYARATMPGMSQLQRVALVWSGAVDLNLHAFEYGAAPGGPGHVWQGAEQDMRAYLRGQAGLLQAFEPIDGRGDRIEVYSFAAGRRSAAGAIEIAIEHGDRGAAAAPPYCGAGAEAEPSFRLVTLGPGGRQTQQLRIAAAPCGASLAGAERYLQGFMGDIVVSR